MSLSASYLQKIIQQYRSRGIVLDTNILVLYLIGVHNPSVFSHFSCIKDSGFTESDFSLLYAFVGQFVRIVITPQILAEISHHTFDKERGCEGEYFNSMINTLSTTVEEFIPKDAILQCPPLRKLGFTDSSIYEVARKEGLLVVTEDHKLNGMLNAKKIDCINFTYLRFPY